MALSSNWLELQKSQTGSPKNGKVVKKSKKQAAAKAAKPALKAKKPSRIMSMVYSMNEEIEKSQQNKRDGKVFEFKEETIKSVGDADGLDELSGNAGSGKSRTIGKYLAMDCEFVGVGPEGEESALARVSLVNYYGHVILDEFVRPREKVTDWRTWVSGVKPKHMKEALSFKEVQEKVSKLLEGRILVGHSIKHDLEALLISHPKSSIRDTSRHLPFRQAYAKGKTPSLKKLAKGILNRDIQVAEHSSVEDARVTMQIYKSDRKEIEKLHRISFKVPKREN